MIATPAHTCSFLQRSVAREWVNCMFVFCYKLKLSTKHHFWFVHFFLLKLLHLICSTMYHVILDKSITQEIASPTHITQPDRKHQHILSMDSKINFCVNSPYTHTSMPTTAAKLNTPPQCFKTWPHTSKCISSICTSLIFSRGECKMCLTYDNKTHLYIAFTFTF